MREANLFYYNHILTVVFELWDGLKNQKYFHPSLYTYWQILSQYKVTLIKICLIKNQFCDQRSDQNYFFSLSVYQIHVNNAFLFDFTKVEGEQKIAFDQKCLPKIGNLFKLFFDGPWIWNVLFTNWHVKISIVVSWKNTTTCQSIKETFKGPINHN
jgi:hypothetical protein